MMLCTSNKQGDSKMSEEVKVEKIYVGNAKVQKSQYGDILKLKIGPNDVEKINKWAKDNEGWVNISIMESKKPSDKGYTHYAIIDQWKPDPSKSKKATGTTSASKPDDSDNLPF